MATPPTLRRPSPRPSSRLLLPFVALVVVVLALLGSAVGLLVDLLWFRSVGFASVFTGVLSTRVLLFVLFGTLVATFVGANLVVAHRLRPPFTPMSAEQQNLERYRTVLEPRLLGALLLATAAIGLFVGLAASAGWEIWLAWRNGTQFGEVDAQFGRDISYFAFTYPFQRFVLGFAFGAVVLAGLASVAAHYLFGGLRLQSPGDKLTRGARGHLAVLVGLFVLLKAFAYYLDRFGLAFSPRGTVTGPSYTDVTAVLPAKTFLVVAAIVSALLFFAAAFRGGWRVPALALGVLTLSAVVAGGVVPALVQQVRVNPNEIALEAPYIERNIEATRAAYGIDDVEIENSPGDATVQEVGTAIEQAGGGREAVPARLLDPALLSPTFQQLQQLRTYYGFSDQLDVDRYDFGDGMQDYVVAARGLDLGGLPAGSGWIQEHLIYTHGNGFVAAPAAQVNALGQPVFEVGDLPQRAPDGVEVEQSRIYYGENAPDYSIAPSRRPEIDGPRDTESLTQSTSTQQEDEASEGTVVEDDAAAAAAADAGVDAEESADESDQRTTRYEGDGGVGVGSLWRKLLFAVNYQEANFLLSDDIEEDSKVLFVRDPADRVAEVAPWLTLDGDTYPVLAQMGEGGTRRTVWVVDGYTTTDGYPYSELVALGDVATDALTGQRVLPVGQVNYIRNSVKAVVDAYDGSITLYAFDESDPVLRTWQKAFPGTVEPRSAIPEDLEAHFRYPQDLFKAQRDLLTRYHVQNPQAFFSKEDFWTIPQDPTRNVQEPQPPFYLYLQPPGADSETFALTTVFNAVERPNLTAFLSASSDPGDYGRLRLLRLRNSDAVPGPGQVQNNFSSDTGAATVINILRQGGSEVVFGNLLTLPVGEGLVYVEPVYVRGTQDESFPLLRRVLVGFDNEVAFEPTLEEALDVLFQGARPGDITGPDGQTIEQEPPSGGQQPEPTEPPAPGDGDGTAPTPGPAPDDPRAALEQGTADLEQAFNDSQAALRDGDFAAYGEAQDRLADAISRVLAAEAALAGETAPAEAPAGG